ncbi:MAG: Flp pilus assembly complex ATPase component TadA, partial [Desulfobacteraceae bacterium]|nr:Flp pilus assembly complex ATPase component TadA [Desulfobacteraceae bacterium]
MIEEFINIIAQKTSLSKENCEKIKGAYGKDPTRLVESAIETKLVLENEVLEALSLLYSIPFNAVLALENAGDDWTADISRQFLKKFCIAPLTRKGSSSIIAINDPSDLGMVDDIAALLNLDVYSLVLAPRNQILSAVNTLYDRAGESAQQLVENMEDDGFTIIDDFEQTADLLDDTSDAPVIRLVNHMISQAVKAMASDIHIEPFQDVLKVRYRIDGILYEMLSPPKGIQASLISRIKVMAKMNIAEKRLPQDGRFEVKIGDQSIDIRVSTIPITHGERLVLRLLIKSNTLFRLAELGLNEENLEILNQLISTSHGIILVTGPTGSGKT